MTCDHWKTTNPEDERLGPEPEDDMPQEDKTPEPSHSDPAIIAGGIMLGQFEASRRGALTIWTIYDKPADHPEGFIARRFEMSEGGRTLATRDTLAGKLDDIRMALEKAGLMKMSRRDGDEPQVVENWA